MRRVIAICVFASALAALSANLASAENVKVNTTVPTVKVPAAKPLDQTSPLFFQSLHAGQHFNQVTIESGGGAPKGAVTQKGREGTVSQFHNGTVVYDKKPPKGSGIEGLTGVDGESLDDKVRY